MTFVYDVYVNFQTVCYDFFEWNKQDKITHIKRIPIFQIQENIFQKLIVHDYQIDKKTQEILRGKTEIYRGKKKLTAALFTDNKDILAVLLDKNGNIIKKSFLLLEEEKTILKSIRKIDFLNIAVTELEKRVLPLETRHEQERKAYLLKEFLELEDSQLLYLYFECFGKTNSNRKWMQEKLTEQVLMGNEEVSNISYHFLKLICNQ